MNVILNRTNQGFEELNPRKSFVDTQGNQTSYDSLLVWSPQALAARNLFKREIEPVPEGMVADGYEWIADENNRPVFSHINLRSNVPDPFPPLSRAAFFNAALTIGIRKNMIRQAINSIPDELEREKALIAFEENTQFHRNNPLLLSIAAKLGKTDEEINAAWQQAMKLE